MWPKRFKEWVAVLIELYKNIVAVLCVGISFFIICGHTWIRGGIGINHRQIIIESATHSLVHYYSRAFTPML